MAKCELREAGAPDSDVRQIHAALRRMGTGLLTPEMIQAGVFELLSRDVAEDPGEAIIRDVFQAIVEASPKCPS